MKVYRLSVPGKTFVLGEYGVLSGGSAFLLSTSPCFFLNVSKEKGPPKGFPKGSPAYRWLTTNSNSHYRIEFIDPYKGLGGMGASSAQFLLSYLHTSQNASAESIQKIWKIYKDLSFQKEGLSPSGADLVSQFSGGWTLFRSSPFKVESFSWPFLSEGFAIFHTGHKVPTHEHLKTLKPLDKKVAQSLSQKAEEGAKSFQKKDIKMFLKTLELSQKELESQNLVTSLTKEILKKIKKSSLFLGAKGCGALGADTLFCIFEAQRAKEVRVWAEKEGLCFLTDKEESLGFSEERSL